MNLLQKTKKFKGIQIKKANSGELLFKNALDKLGVKYKYQFMIPPFIVDFYLPKHALILEIDGDVHNNKSCQERDIYRETYLMSFRFFISRYNLSYHAESPIQFLKHQLELYPKIGTGRKRGINQKMARIKFLAQIEGFQIFTNKNYEQNWISFKTWQKRKNFVGKHPEFVKNKKEALRDRSLDSNIFEDASGSPARSKGQKPAGLFLFERINEG